MTRVRVVSLRSFDPVIAGLSPKAFRAWQRSLDWSCFHATDGLLTAEDIKAIGPTPATLQELIQRGVWKVDQDGRTFVAELREGPVVAEVEGCEVEHSKLPMTPAERSRRYRERHGSTSRRRDESSRNGVKESDEKRDGRDVTVVTKSPNPPPILSDSGSSPDPESYSALTSSSDLTGSARVQRNRRRSALPKDWKPTPEHIERASKTGLDLDRESLRFRTHHEAKGSLMANWNAAFTTWLLNAVEWAKPPGAVAHEQRRAEERNGAPYHEPFRLEPAEPKASPAETLEAISAASKAIGRRIA